MFSNEVITALIGALSALCVVALKDFLLRGDRERRLNQRILLQARIEQAYGPLEYLAYQFLHADNLVQREKLAEEIGGVLQHYSHLLTEPTISAFYTLLEDENAGAYLLDQNFYVEFLTLKARYYKQWDSQQDMVASSVLPFCNRTPDNLIGEHISPFTVVGEVGYGSSRTRRYNLANPVAGT